MSGYRQGERYQTDDEDGLKNIGEGIHANKSKGNAYRQCIDAGGYGQGEYDFQPMGIETAFVFIAHSFLDHTDT